MKLLFLFFIAMLINCGASLNDELHAPYSSPTDTEGNNPEETQEILTIIVMDVGQGDATLIITPSFKTILIDGGPLEAGTNIILPLMSQLGVSHLDTIFASQYDADHIAGISEVLLGSDGQGGTSDDVNVDIVYDRGGVKEEGGAIFDGYLEAVSEKRQTLSPGDIIDTEDGVTLECVVINGRTNDGQLIPLDDDDENGRSMGLLLSFGEASLSEAPFGPFRYFTAGDLTGGGTTGSEETADLESLIAPLVGTVDVVHINHHGSQTSSNTFYLETLQPTVALISTGDDNPYGHPHSSVLNRLETIGAQVYQTEGGNGGVLPSAHIADDSIFIEVEEDGNYWVNDDRYETRNSNESY